METSPTQDLQDMLSNIVVSQKRARKEMEAESAAVEQQIEQERREYTHRGRPRKGDVKPILSDTHCVTSLTLDRVTYNKICAVARLNGLSYRELVDAIFAKWVETYEQKHGPITARESKISADELV